MQRETKGTRTKRQLYQCAIALFRERGFERVSVDEIVRAAGMAKGTFYIYFDSKSDIILEMLRQYDDYYDEVMAALPAGLTVEQRLEQIVRAACRFTEEVIGLDLIRVLYAKQLAGSQPALLDEDRALFRILSDLIAAGQDAGRFDRFSPAPVLTAVLMRGIRAAFFAWCSSGGQLDLPGECLRFVHIFCRGISAGTE